MIKNKVSTVVSAVIIVSMLSLSMIISIPGKPALEVAKTAGEKKVEVIKAIQNA